MPTRDLGPRRAVIVSALVLASATGGCVDKTPPPLWPTPPPPPMATPIGEPAQAETAAPATSPEDSGDEVTASTREPPPGGLGPWQPERVDR